jgi:hypothetical protein
VESRCFLKRHESRRRTIWEEEGDLREEVGEENTMVGMNKIKGHYINTWNCHNKTYSFA